jgi:hypothetical protein
VFAGPAAVGGRFAGPAAAVRAVGCAGLVLHRAAPHIRSKER